VKNGPRIALSGAKGDQTAMKNNIVRVRRGTPPWIPDLPSVELTGVTGGGSPSQDAGNGEQGWKPPTGNRPEPEAVYHGTFNFPTPT
jgi:hypothetical protein